MDRTKKEGTRKSGRGTRGSKNFGSQVYLIFFLVSSISSLGARSEEELGRERGTKFWRCVHRVCRDRDKVGCTVFPKQPSSHFSRTLELSAETCQKKRLPQKRSEKAVTFFFVEKDFASGGKWENKASGERQKQERGKGEHERKKRQERRKEEKRRRARWRDKERDEDEGFERKTGGKRSLRAKLGLLRSFLLSLYALHISPPPSFLSTLKIPAQRLRGPVRQIFLSFQMWRIGVCLRQAIAKATNFAALLRYKP